VRLVAVMTPAVWVMALVETRATVPAGPVLTSPLRMRLPEASIEASVAVTEPSKSNRLLPAASSALSVVMLSDSRLASARAALLVARTPAGGHRAVEEDAIGRE